MLHVEETAVEGNSQSDLKKTRIRQRATLRPTKAWLPLSTAAPAALFNGMPTAAQARLVTEQSPR
eukprot:2619191-Amphidinium_carterae.1